MINKIKEDKDQNQEIKKAKSKNTKRKSTDTEVKVDDFNLNYLFVNFVLCIVFFNEYLLINFVFMFNKISNQFSDN